MKTVVVLLAAFAIGSITGRFIDTAPAASKGPMVGDSTAAAFELPASSVYHIESTWTNQGGAEVDWPSLQGRHRLVAFFFTHCGFACPRIVYDLKDILNEVPADDRRAVGVVLVSIDPEHDTPEALQAYGMMHGLDELQWTLLRSADSNVRELAAALGVRYKRQAGGDFAHSNAIVLLDERGEIAARRDGPEAGIQSILDALDLTE